MRKLVTTVAALAALSSVMIAPASAQTATEEGIATGADRGAAVAGAPGAVVGGVIGGAFGLASEPFVILSGGYAEPVRPYAYRQRCWTDAWGRRFCDYR